MVLLGQQLVHLLTQRHCLQELRPQDDILCTQLGDVSDGLLDQVFLLIQVLPKTRLCVSSKGYKS